MKIANLLIVCGVSDGPDGANAENAINDSARTRNGTGKKTWELIIGGDTTEGK